MRDFGVRKLLSRGNLRAERRAEVGRTLSYLLLSDSNCEILRMRTLRQTIDKKAAWNDAFEIYLHELDGTTSILLLAPALH